MLLLSINPYKHRAQTGVSSLRTIHRHPTNDKIILHVQRRPKEKTVETSKDTKPYLKWEKSDFNKHLWSCREGELDEGR